MVTEGERLTYAELAGRVAARAERLGTGRRLVMIAGGNDLDVLVSYLAALAGGHVAWLVPDLARAEGLRRRFRPDVVAAPGALLAESPGAPRHELHPDLALLLPTSGSTGAPRLVRLSGDNLAANAGAIAESLDIGPDERAITSLPLHYCYGLSVVNSHLARGARVILTPRSVTDPAFWELARRESATSLAGVPHTFDLLERVGFAEMDLPAMRYVTQAGGRLAPAAVRSWAGVLGRAGLRLHVMYGQTEATARMACLPAGLAAARPASAGRAIPGGAFRVEPVPESDAPGVGELVYRGPNVMLGYADGPDDLVRGREVEELRTGDLGRIGPDGIVEVVGRRSRFLKLVGLRIDLEEVERITAAMGVTAHCAGSDDRLVVGVAGQEPPAPGLRRLLAERLGLPVARVDVLHVPDPPLLPSGKPDHAALVALADRAPAPAPAAPGDDVAAAVARVLAETLGRDDVGPSDSFTGLGGDSLSYVDASLGLEEALGELPADWPELTVAELAAAAGRPGRAARMETSLLMRAAAITLVVATHMTAFWPAGGAHLLLGLAGHSFARFGLAPGRQPADLVASAGRIALPAALWAALVAVLGGGYTLACVLLANNLLGDDDVTSGRWQLWFVEGLVQILLVLAALMAVPALRRIERSRPLLVPLVLLAPALLAREAWTSAGDPARFFRPHLIIWAFLLGWAVQRAGDTRGRLAVTLAIGLALPGAFDDPVREAIVASGLLVVLWVPTVTVPRPLARVAGAVAAASLAIYLTHWQAWPVLDDLMPIALAIPATIAVGVAAWAAAGRLAAALRVLRARREDGGGGPRVRDDAHALAGREELVGG